MNQTTQKMDESWAQAFHFTEDLDALEAEFQREHQAELKAHTGGLKVNTDRQFLDQLSESIAHRLGDQLGDPAVLSQYFRIQELERDNHTMATHIETLLTRVQKLEAENKALRIERTRFHRLVGNLYIKM